MSTLISVVIPTLNEGETVGATLTAVLKLEPEVEVIVADGGSTDDTVEVAEAFGARVIHAARGRGSQMGAGAEHAAGDILWFLHADTAPEREAAGQIYVSLLNPRVVAGNFAVEFEGETAAARFLTWLYPRLRLLGIVYGDSGIFVRRDVYERVGGFRPYPIFEDLDLVSRLKQAGEVVTLPARVRTSSRRFEGRSFVVVFVQWVVLQLLYWAGVSPERLGRLYFPRSA